MKKIVGLILLAVMVLIAVPAKSQIKFGIKGGLNISSVHFNKDLVGKDNVTGFNIGPMVEVMAPIMGVGFDAAILYSQKGIGVKSEKDIKNDYIDVPVNLKWKFGLLLSKDIWRLVRMSVSVWVAISYGIFRDQSETS